MQVGYRGEAISLVRGDKLCSAPCKKLKKGIYVVFPALYVSLCPRARDISRWAGIYEIYVPACVRQIESK